MSHPVWNQMYSLTWHPPAQPTAAPEITSQYNPYRAYFPQQPYAVSAAVFNGHGTNYNRVPPIPSAAFEQKLYTSQSQAQSNDQNQRVPHDNGYHQSRQPAPTPVHAQLRLGPHGQSVAADLPGHTKQFLRDPKPTVASVPGRHSFGSQQNAPLGSDDIFSMPLCEHHTAYQFPAVSTTYVPYCKTENGLSPFPYNAYGTLSENSRNAVASQHVSGGQASNSASPALLVSPLVHEPPRSDLSSYIRPPAMLVPRHASDPFFFNTRPTYSFEGSSDLSINSPSMFNSPLLPSDNMEMDAYSPQDFSFPATEGVDSQIEMHFPGEDILGEADLLPVKSEPTETIIPMTGYAVTPSEQPEPRPTTIPYIRPVSPATIEACLEPFLMEWVFDDDLLIDDGVPMPDYGAFSPEAINAARMRNNTNNMSDDLSLDLVYPSSSP